MKNVYRSIPAVFGISLLLAAGSARAEYSKDLVDAQTKAANANAGKSTQKTSMEEFIPRHLTTSSSTTEAKEVEQGLPQAEEYDLGQNTTTQSTVPLRNMQAFGQMADSEDLQKHFKALIKKRVPVHYMTMMMVENGAATGFIGAMAGLNGVYQNTVQSHELQLAQMQAFDSTGMAVKQYEKSLVEQLQVDGHKDAYVPALWAVNADVIDPDSGGANTGPKPLPMKYKYPQSLASTKGAQADPAIDPNKLNGSPPNAEKEKLISKILTEVKDKEAQGSNGEKHKNGSKLQEFEQEFVKLLGDIKLSVEDKSGAHVRTVQFIQPEKIEGRRALDYVDRKNIEEVWENTQKVLQEYCKFKGGDDNYSKDIFDKLRPAKVFDDKKDERDKASAPDMPLTIPYVDQIFRLMASGQPLVKDKCSQLFDSSVDKMPSIDDTAGAAATFDDCQNEPKKCLRNKVILTGVKLVARSRTLHQYLYLIDAANRLSAASPEVQNMLGQLVDNALEGVNIETEIADNRERWIGFSNFLGQLAQGQAAGSVFRPMISAAGSNQ